MTPAQDRLAFASMNVLDGTESQRPARVAEGLDRGGGADDAGRSSSGTTPTWTTRRSTPARPSAPPWVGSPSPSATARRSSTTASAWPPRKPALLTDLPGPAEREPGPRLRRRRPLHPGLLGRPVGGLPRRAEPGPPRARRRRLQLDGAGLRQDVLDQHGPGDTPQPARLQGRHAQHQGPADRPARRLRLGREGQRPALDAGRQLPHQPPHSDLHRELGPGLPRGPAERHRPGQGHRCAPDRRRGVHQPALHPEERPGSTRHSGQRAHPPGQPRGEQRDPAAAPGLLLHRRHRSRARHPARRAVLHRLRQGSRVSSSRCRTSSGPTTRSTSTSSTSGAASSPCRAGWRAAGTGATASSPEPTGPPVRMSTDPYPCSGCLSIS